MHTAIQELFEYAAEQDLVDCDYHKTVNKGHGRIEVRECWTTAAPDYLWYLPNLKNWAGLRSVAVVKAVRQTDQESAVDFRYFISSLERDVQQILKAVRTRWESENKAHWILDVVFREDDCRVRKGQAAQNFAVLRHIALNLLRQETTLKRGIKDKRLKAGWDHDYLLKVLTA